MHTDDASDDTNSNKLIFQAHTHKPLVHAYAVFNTRTTVHSAEMQTHAEQKTLLKVREVLVT